MSPGDYRLIQAHNLSQILIQGSYASGKCQGNLNFFKVRELSGNFMLCQGKMNVLFNVREMSGNFKIFSLYQMMRNRK